MTVEFRCKKGVQRIPMFERVCGASVRFQFAEWMQSAVSSLGEADRSAPARPEQFDEWFNILFISVAHHDEARRIGLPMLIVYCCLAIG